MSDSIFIGFSLHIVHLAGMQFYTEWDYNNIRVKWALKKRVRAATLKPSSISTVFTLRLNHETSRVGEQAFATEEAGLYF